VSAFVATNILSTNAVFAAIVSVFVCSNLVLITILARVWLIERYPRLKAYLSKLPGITFGVPVPEHLRPVKPLSDKVAEPEVYSESTSNFSEFSPSVQQPDRPFTLATLEFEPPEPMGKAARAEAEFPILDSVVVEPAFSRGVEGAFHKSKKVAEKTQQQLLLERFHWVCRMLKRMNEEVAVWTEGELATLANSMLIADSNTQDMIAILLPQRVVRVSCHRTFEFEHHATVLNNILLATGQDLDVNFINSSKDESSGQCIVNFEHKGKPVTWRFTEKENNLSNKFLNTALTWVAKQASGRFELLSDDEYKRSYVFVSHQIELALEQSESQPM